MLGIAISVPRQLNGQVQSTPAQDSSKPRLGAKAELENPEPERGPVPEDSDPDLAKRPALLAALAKKRLVLGLHSVFTLENSYATDKVLESAKAVLRARWVKVIAPEFLPSEEEAIEWRGSNDYPTAPQQRRVGARWETPIGVMITESSEFSSSIKVCLQLSGEDRISFRFHGPHEGTHAERPEDTAPQDILDKPRLLEILTNCFRFPFDTVKDFRVVNGPSGVYEGVRIFSGSFRWSRSRLADRPELGQLGRGWKEYNEADLFITDSEPQYFCIGMSLGGGD
jgi:hypothetical protein